MEEKVKTLSALELVKLRNGITSDVRDDFINTLIIGTKEHLKHINGINLVEGNVAHDVFLADYVSWRYDNQGDDRMPAHIRLRLNELWNTSEKSDDNEL